MITDRYFDANFCISNKLNLTDVVILTDIYSWVFSNNPPEIIEIENKKYFYISQTYLSNRHTATLSRQTILRTLNKLKSIGIISDSKIIGMNRKNYVSFNWNKIKESLANKQELESINYNVSWYNFLDSYNKDIGGKTVLFEDDDITPKKYSKEAEQFVVDILTEHSALFPNKIPKDLNNPTKTFGNACKIMQDIYNGNFTNPRFYHLAPDFENNKQFDVQDWKKTIKAVKGDWNKIKQLFENSICNFSKMFEADRMPFNKKYLQNNFEKWMYDDFTFGRNNATSQFIQSLKEPMFTRKKLSEDKADAIFQLLQPKAKNGGNKLFELNKAMASGAFWENVEKIVQWGQTLCEYDDCVQNWIETPSEIPGLFADYLIENKINVSLATVDISKAVECNGPWCWFIQQVSDKYGLNKNLFNCVTSDDFYDCYSESNIPVF